MAKVLEKDTETISRLFGFRSRKEFVQDAVLEKVYRLKSVLFSRITEKVRRGFSRKGFTEEEILRNFESFRHS